MDYFRKLAAERRRATIAARKGDGGCDCHGLDMLRCPNYKPSRVVRPTSINTKLTASSKLSSATVRWF